MKRNTDQETGYRILSERARRISEKSKGSAEATEFTIAKLSMPYSKGAEKVLRDSDYIIFREQPDDQKATKAVIGLGDGRIVELYHP